MLVLSSESEGLQNPVSMSICWPPIQVPGYSQCKEYLCFLRKYLLPFQLKKKKQPAKEFF